MTSQPAETRRPNRLERRLSQSALLFEADVLDQLVARDPENVAYLAALGQACSKLKHHNRGLAVDRRLVEAKPDDPTFRYNLACSLVLTGDLDEACEQLLRAIELGYRDFVHLRRDEDLIQLRNDARFATIQERIAQVEV